MHVLYHQLGQSRQQHYAPWADDHWRVACGGKPYSLHALRMRHELGMCSVGFGAMVIDSEDPSDAHPASASKIVHYPQRKYYENKGQLRQKYVITKKSIRIP